MTKEEIAKKIATQIVCECCASVIPVIPERCKEDPCGTWYDGYRCALKAYQAGYDDAVDNLVDIL